MRLAGLLAMAALSSCAMEKQPEPIPLFPGIRAVPDGRVVEIDARTTPFFDSFEEGAIYLELVACSPNSREHETLLIVDARASNIHAALLAAGFTPGSPTVWTFENGRAVATPPTGDPLSIELVYSVDGAEQRVSPEDWIIHEQTGERPAPGAFVFSGSRIVRYQRENRYDADYTGTLIGLTAFGGEVISWPEPISPESSIDEPVWIADEDAVPPGDTPVVIAITSP